MTIVGDIKGNDQNRDQFISIRGLSKRYQEGDGWRIVLEEASASFSRSEFIAITGKSGSGKSTLLNLISGIDLADQGEIWVAGENLIRLDEHKRTLFRRRHIGFIFQSFNLLPTLTVLENVRLPLELKGGSSSENDRIVSQRLMEVGLLDRKAAFPDRLSGGEQQRVAIARALAHDPLLVLADEPTGNLDDETGQQILELLDRLTRQSGKNLILVTHSAEAASYADRIFHLHDGKLIDNGAGERLAWKRMTSHP
jgi:putative ABC transport system ATP-binding protein